jgi:hypothetical protein
MPEEEEERSVAGKLGQQMNRRALEGSGPLLWPSHIPAWPAKTDTTRPTCQGRDNLESSTGHACSAFEQPPALHGFRSSLK